MKNGIAPLGLIDKWNGSAAIIETKWLDRKLTCVLRDGGTAGFYAAQNPASIRTETGEPHVSYDPATRLLKVHTPSGHGSVSITLSFS